MRRERRFRISRELVTDFGAAVSSARGSAHAASRAKHVRHLTGQFFLILRLFQLIQLRRDSEQSLVEALNRALDS